MEHEQDQSDEEHMSFAVALTQLPSTQDAETPPEHASQPPESISQPTDTAASETSAKSTPPPSSNAHDPLRWFGILVPPALRTAQSTFTATVEGPVPSLIMLSRELRRREMEIGRVKKAMRKLS